MSVNWINYIFNETKLAGGDLLVALAVADQANDAGNAFPGSAAIAKRTRLSGRQVTRICSRLERAGYMQIIRGAGRGNKTVIQLQKVTSPSPFKPVKGDKPVTVYEKKKVTLTAVKGDIDDKKNAPIRNEPFKPFTDIPTTSDASVAKTDTDFIFQDGRPYLINSAGMSFNSAGTFLGSKRKLFTDAEVAAAIRAAMDEKPIEPKGFITAVLKRGRNADAYVGKSDDNVQPVFGSPDCPHCLGSGNVEVENPAAEYSFTRRGFRTCPTCSGGKLENGYEIIKPGPPPVLPANSNANV